MAGKRRVLLVPTEKFAACKLEADAAIPAWATEGGGLLRDAHFR